MQLFVLSKRRDLRFPIHVQPHNTYRVSCVFAKVDCVGEGPSRILGGGAWGGRLFFLTNRYFLISQPVLLK